LQRVSVRDDLGAVGGEAVVGLGVAAAVGVGEAAPDDQSVVAEPVQATLRRPRRPDRRRLFAEIVGW
jgi:hypothetical protein